MKKIIQKITVCTAAVLMIPFISTRPVNAAMGPETESFYDGNFEYVISTKDGEFIDSWSENYEQTAGAYVQPEIVPAKEPEKITILCIENQYHGIDSNIVIPESSASGCGFASLGESSNEYYYTATEADWNGQYAVLTDYRGPDIDKLVIPEYLNDGTKVAGIFFDTTVGKGKARQSAVKTLSIPDSLKVVSIQPGMFPELEKINASETNSGCKIVDGVLFSKDMRTLLYYPPGLTNQSYTVPEGVTSISSLNGNKNLKELTLPSTLNYVFDSFLLGSSVEKITVNGNNRNFSSEDGILYQSTYGGNPTLVFYPVTKTDKSFTVKKDAVATLEAFANNPYLEELTLGSLTFSEYTDYSKVDIPNLKSVNFVEGPDWSNPYRMHSVFSYDGIVYYTYAKVTDNMSKEEKFAEDVNLLYYPHGKTDEFYEFPEGIKGYDNGVLGDHVEAIYIHKNSHVSYTGKNLKYVYLEAGAENNYYGSSVLTKENITLEDAKAHFESAKKAEQQKEEEAQKPQETKEPEPAETAEPTPTPTPVPTAAPAKPQSSGSAGLIAGGVILIAAAAGAYVFLKKKQTPSK